MCQFQEYTALLHWQIFFFLTVLGLNDTSTLVGQFVPYSREREKRDRRDSRGDERVGQEREENE